MEDAARALLITAGVLFAFLVLNLGIYAVSNIQGTADAYTEHSISIELQKYNSKFETFVGRKDITAQEIITLAGTKNEYEIPTTVYVDKTNVSSFSEDEKKKFISENLSKYEKDDSLPNGKVALNLFSYVSIRYGENGQVIEIKFKKN